VGLSWLRSKTFPNKIFLSGELTFLQVYSRKDSQQEQGNAEENKPHHSDSSGALQIEYEGIFHISS
jgi:hypothetical protein